MCLTSINTNVFGQELKAGTKLVLEKRRIVILSHLLTDTGFLKERLWDIFYILCILAFISIQLCLYSVCLVLFRIPEPHPQKSNGGRSSPSKQEETFKRTRLVVLMLDLTNPILQLCSQHNNQTNKNNVRRPQLFLHDCALVLRVSCFKPHSVV